MKKNFLRILAVAAFASYNVDRSNNNETEGMSDTMLANVEALAGGENGSFNCWWDSVYYLICYNGGDWTGCPCGSHNW